MTAQMKWVWEGLPSGIFAGLNSLSFLADVKRITISEDIMLEYFGPSWRDRGFEYEIICSFLDVENVEFWPFAKNCILI